jgi:ATP-dependent exoDNAse (exonuclease V) beta subunit
MAPIKSSRQDTEPISDYIRWINRRKQELEDLRLLYVAATRARRRLHLFGHVRFNKKGECSAESGSLLDRLWPALREAFTALTPPAAEQNGAPLWQAAPGDELRIAGDWRPDLPGEAVTPPETPAGHAIDFEWAGDTARHVGTLTHRYLERIGEQGAAQWSTERLAAQRPAIRTGLAALGIDPDVQDAACDKVMRALEQTLAHEEGRWILAAHEQAACELPLTVLGDDHQPHQYVIDRTFVADGTRWIVDYKTGEHLGTDVNAFLDQEQERYREQLETYARAMRLRENLPVKLALYFPLLQAWRVWEPRVESD